MLSFDYIQKPFGTDCLSESRNPSYLNSTKVCLSPKEQRLNRLITAIRTGKKGRHAGDQRNLQRDYITPTEYPRPIDTLPRWPRPAGRNHETNRKTDVNHRLATVPSTAICVNRAHRTTRPNRQTATRARLPCVSVQNIPDATGKQH